MPDWAWLCALSWFVRHTVGHVLSQPTSPNLTSKNQHNDGSGRVRNAAADEPGDSTCIYWRQTTVEPMPTSHCILYFSTVVQSQRGCQLQILYILQSLRFIYMNIVHNTTYIYII